MVESHSSSTQKTTTTNTHNNTAAQNIGNNNNKNGMEGSRIVREPSDFDILDVVRTRASATDSEEQMILEKKGIYMKAAAKASLSNDHDNDDNSLKQSDNKSKIGSRTNGGISTNKSHTSNNRSTASNPVSQQQKSSSSEEDFDIMMKVVRKRAAIMDYHQAHHPASRTRTPAPAESTSGVTTTRPPKTAATLPRQEHEAVSEQFDIMDVVRKREHRSTMVKDCVVQEDGSSGDQQQQQPTQQQQQQRISEASQPGAYSEAFGHRPHLRESICYSLFDRAHSNENDDEEGGQAQPQSSSSHYGPSITPPPPTTTTTTTTTTARNENYFQQQQQQFAGDDDEGSGDNNNGGNLVRAIPVTSERVRTFAFLSARRLQPMETSSEASTSSHSRTDRKYKNRFLLFLTICVLISVGAIVFGVAFRAIREGAKDNEEANPKSSSSSSSSSPSSPTVPQVRSQSPSFSPTGILDQFVETLPLYTLESLMNPSSPQSHAKIWLEEHPEILLMEEWRKRQLFALVTFYYSMDGDNWPQLVRDNWLLYDKSECFWFANAFGDFDSTTGDWLEYHYYKDQTVGLPCNNDGEYQLLDLSDLKLSGLTPTVPPEMSLITSLNTIVLKDVNSSVPVADFLPLQMFQMTHLETLYLPGNSLFGSLPTELGFTTQRFNLSLVTNSLTGTMPSEMGLMRGLEYLYLNVNNLNGSLPTQLGSMTNAAFVTLSYNSFSGVIPTEVGLMHNSTLFSLGENNLSGTVPSELGLMTKLTYLSLGMNSLSFSLPSQLGLLTQLTGLHLLENSFTGTVPSQLGMLASSLDAIQLENTALTGTIPEPLCSLGMYKERYQLGLSFNCSDKLCGCCWCPCPNNSNGNSITEEECQVLPPKLLDPSLEDEEWPGKFPSPINLSNTVTINVKTDDYPEEIKWDWSVLSDGIGIWELLDSQRFHKFGTLYNSTIEVLSERLYKLQIFDAFHDGTCCFHGFGWFTITSSLLSPEYPEAGSLVWGSLAYVFETSLEIYVWIDQDGNAHHVEYAAGEGFVLPIGGDDSRTIVVPDGVLSFLNASSVTESDPGNA